MFKRKIVALTIFACIICSGIAYASWTNQTKVDVNAKTGKLSYEIGSRNKCVVTLGNGEQEYTVLPTNMELVLGEQDTLIITVSKEMLDNTFENNPELSVIKIAYELSPTEKNTINQIQISNSKDEIKAGSGINNNATQGQLNEHPIMMTCGLESNFIGNATKTDEPLSVEITQKLTLDNPLAYINNQALEFDLGVLISQKSGRNDEKDTANHAINSSLFTYCLWNQAINLHCKLVII